jgi:predicted DCC family thiol-disulfide oxidoreductase YuxK
MAGIRLPYNPSGGTEALFVAAYFLLLFGLYSDQDYLSVDAARRTANASVAELDRFLRSDEQRTYRMSALRSYALVLGILYFGAGLMKILVNPGLSWTAPDSLARYVTYNSFVDHDYRPVGEFLSASPVLLSASAWGTLVLELGFLVAALVGLSLTPFVLGLIGLHIGIGLALDPFFFDFIVFLILFAAYDSAISRFTWDRPIEVVYDDQCRHCVRVLSLFEMLDLNGALSFYRPSDAPEEYRDQLDPDLAGDIHVFVDNDTYSGYRAFRELLVECRLFLPFTLAMRVRPIESIGKHVYRYAATDRNR